MKETEEKTFKCGCGCNILSGSKYLLCVSATHQHCLSTRITNKAAPALMEPTAQRRTEPFKHKLLGELREGWQIHKHVTKTAADSAEATRLC